MAITWNNIENGKGLEVVITCDTSAKEILSTMNEISQDLKLSNRTWELWDFSGVGDFNFSFEDIVLITSREKKFIASKKGLFIKAGTHSKDLTFGMWRVYEALSVEQPNMHIGAFRSRTSAIEWINEILSKHNTSIAADAQKR